LSELQIIHFSDINKIRKVYGTIPAERINIRQLDFLSDDEREYRSISSLVAQEPTESVELEEKEVIVGFYVTYDTFNIAAIGLIAWRPDIP
jgi:hypothetical protein